MKNDYLENLMDRYIGALKKLGAKSKEFDDFDAKSNDYTNQEKLDYALWMAEKIKTFIKSSEIDKAYRWLGFLQGILWEQGIYTINEMRNQNRVK